MSSATMALGAVCTCDCFWSRFSSVRHGFARLRTGAVVPQVICHLKEESEMTNQVAMVVQAFDGGAALAMAMLVAAIAARSMMSAT